MCQWTRRMVSDKLSMLREWEKCILNFSLSSLSLNVPSKSERWTKPIQAESDLSCCFVWSCILLEAIIKRDAITQWANWFSSLWNSIVLLATGIENQSMFLMANKSQGQDSLAPSVFSVPKTTNTTLEDLHLKSETHSIWWRTDLELSWVRISVRISQSSSN